MRLYLQWSQSVSSVFCCLAGCTCCRNVSHGTRLLEFGMEVLRWDSLSVYFGMFLWEEWASSSRFSSGVINRSKFLVPLFFKPCCWMRSVVWVCSSVLTGIPMCAQHPVTLPVKNRPEDDYLLVETCSLHITLCNINSCADVQISITISCVLLHVSTTYWSHRNIAIIL